MTSIATTEYSENACVVCFKNVVIYSIGDCDHPVCYECSTRMRVLCRQNECPICRQDMPKVIFTKEVQLFRHVKNNSYLMDKKFKICFDNADIQTAYSKLLEHVCKVCHGRPAFRTFQNLKDHMRKEHELYYCDLCVENLKIFTGERRSYTRQELALHRRKGDPDDRSHRGHPLCEFCDQRYMDNDELFRHLRRDHLFCHFCDADGFHQYYSSYDYLRDHFRSEHFLCEEGGCMEEKFTSVFRTEIDLKAHRASVHGRTIGKAATKQARMLELEFTLAPRSRERLDGARGGRRGGRQRTHHDEEDSQGAVGGDYDDQRFETPYPNINTSCIEEFPTLSGEAPPVLSPPQRQNSRKVAMNNGGLTIRTVRQSQPLAVTDENFPALGPEGTASGCKTVRLSVNSGGQDRQNSVSGSSVRGSTQKAPTNVSIHVNHRPSGSSQNIRIRPASVPSQFHDDFPSLGGPKPTNPTSSVQWLGSQGNMGAKSKVQSSSQSQPPKAFRAEEDFPSLSSKFSTGCTMTNTSSSATKSDSRSKKASSVMIPVTSSWTLSQTSSDMSRTHENSTEPNSVPAKSTDGDPSHTASLGNIKVKSKKKKAKNVTHTNSDVLTKSTHTAAKESSANESGKKKKKQANTETDGQRKSQHMTNEKANGIDNSEVENSADYIPALERKRSELLITNLTTEHSPEDNKCESSLSASNKLHEDVCPPFSAEVIEDFPPVSSSACWPPGFDIPKNRKLTSAPPPGFGGGGKTSNLSNVTAPPPGFSVTLNSVARPQTNGLTFTSSSGQSYSILPGRNGNSSHSFVPPQDFSHRNQALVTRVKKTLGDARSMDEFCQVSKMFRQGEINACDFYKHCQETMGTKDFAEIFAELLVLLPDIEKQQLLVFQTECIFSCYSSSSMEDHGYGFVYIDG
ncbi:hypothetical protein ANN_10991 [Periplaneta americana]|uniref:RING-type E3 ubiquitin transferase n=1 Tax=Periplaneta americana TaxID=6978 RepID=A0ABQ8T4Z8_PERAM|nr:hypothetical protein ANN_10991 [Periplaneta americana]